MTGYVIAIAVGVPIYLLGTIISYRLGVTVQWEERGIAIYITNRNTWLSGGVAATLWPVLLASAVVQGVINELVGHPHRD